MMSETNMTKLRYFTVDVFTADQFGGNQLAVVILESRDQISSERMQQIAKEFNFSITSFISPSSDDTNYTASLRIFTTGIELPFSGYPNIGSAYVISKLDSLFGRKVNLINNNVVFEGKAGAVVCEIGSSDGVMIKTPKKYEQAEMNHLKNIIAECLGISQTTIIGNPVSGGCGLSFLLVEVDSEKTLAQCVTSHTALKKYENELKTKLGIGIHAFCKVDSKDGFDYKARNFFQDLDMISKGVVIEDPATGSANCALIGYLGLSNKISCDSIKKISQGDCVGRPSSLNGAYLNDGSVKIGGEVVGVMEGFLTLKQ